MYQHKLLLVWLFCITCLSPRIAHAAVSTKVGFWGTWGIPCGIAMYTQHVSDSLAKLGYILTHYNYKLSPEEVIRCSIRDTIDILNIQFEAGIMPPHKTMLNTLQALKKAQIKIVITMHDEPNWAQDLVNAADICIYHKKPRYLNDLSKVITLPMGVPLFNSSLTRTDMRNKYGFRPEDKILISTGFMLPTKEIGDTLEHLAPYIKKDPTIKVQLLHAFTPRAPSLCQASHKELMQVIEKYQLHNQVVVITNFVSQQELSERIYLSDLGYQWFIQNTNATSATSKEYITARTPLVVPNSTHYHDLQYKGITVTPMDKKVFAATVMRLLYQPEERKVLQNTLEKVYSFLNYDMLIRKYHYVLQKI